MTLGIKFKVKSEKLADEFQKRLKDFSGQTAKATLVVGPEADFWYYQEYGTATRRDAAAGGPTAAYTIKPVTPGVKSLRFPDFEGKYEGLDHDEAGYAYADKIPSSRSREGVSHPGVFPQAFVRDSIPEIMSQISDLLKTALRASGITFAAMRDVIHGPALRIAKDLITEKMSERLRGTRLDGRLQNSTASDVFHSSARVRIDKG